MVHAANCDRGSEDDDDDDDDDVEKEEGTISSFALSPLLTPSPVIAVAAVAAAAVEVAAVACRLLRMGDSLLSPNVCNFA